MKQLDLDTLANVRGGFLPLLGLLTSGLGLAGNIMQSSAKAKMDKLGGGAQPGAGGGENPAAAAVPTAAPTSQGPQQPTASGGG